MIRFSILVLLLLVAMRVLLFLYFFLGRVVFKDKSGVKRDNSIVVYSYGKPSAFRRKVEGSSLVSRKKKQNTNYRYFHSGLVPCTRDIYQHPCIWVVTRSFHSSRPNYIFEDFWETLKDISCCFTSGDEDTSTDSNLPSQDAETPSQGENPPSETTPLLRDSNQQSLPQPESLPTGSSVVGSSSTAGIYNSFSVPVAGPSVPADSPSSTTSPINMKTNYKSAIPIKVAPQQKEELSKPSTLIPGSLRDNIFNNCPPDKLKRFRDIDNQMDPLLEEEEELSDSDTAFAQNKPEPAKVPVQDEVLQDEVQFEE